MVFALLITFSYRTCIVLFSKDDDVKVASSCFANVAIEFYNQESNVL